MRYLDEGKKNVKAKLLPVCDKKYTGAKMLSAGVPVRVCGINKHFARVVMPDNQTGFIQSRYLEDVNHELFSHKTASQLSLLVAPDDTALITDSIGKNTKIKVFGNFNGHYMVNHGDRYCWLKL